MIRNLLLAGVVVVGTFPMIGQAQAFGLGGSGLSIELGDTGIEFDVDDVDDWDDDYDYDYDYDDDDDDDDCIDTGPVEICDD